MTNKPGNKRIFRVIAKAVDYSAVDIEAKNLKDAKRQADELDPYIFNQHNLDEAPDWEIDEVEEVPEMEFPI